VPPDPGWVSKAKQEGSALAAALGSCLVTAHHVGSTAIPGIHAKPILDLMPVVTSLDELDACRPAVEALGYAWWGEFGLPGRRYCTKTDHVAQRRQVQLHCYVRGSPEIERHLAFRDYLRARPDVARDYEREKLRCRTLHSDNSHAYADCKGAWIKKVEAEALAWAIGGSRSRKPV
jgi:GrpB-like predicted nucleotidyltransferase (UPF0157 family)